MVACPCGSKKAFEHCCGMYLGQQKNSPTTPEQLMRSRYTAYSLAQTDYIKHTMKGKALHGFDESQAKEWAKRVIWLELKILDASMQTTEKGFVEFIATFLERNQLKAIHERSEFHLESGMWFYVDGVNLQSSVKNKQKIARNSCCPCGSGKKFKNCHEQ